MFQKFGKNSFNGNFFWFTAEGLTVFHHDHLDRVVEISHCSEEDCFKLEVQSEFENRIRYDYGYQTQITVPSVFTGCNLTNKKLSTAMEINITISCFAWLQ